MGDLMERARPLLDAALTRMKEDTFTEVDRAYFDLELALHALRASVGVEAYRAALPELRKHPLTTKLQEDPFIRHSFTQPRGYPGDAELLDFIYGSGESAEKASAASPWGQLSYRSMRNCISCRAVRYRANDVAERVQQGLKSSPDFRVFSLAAGHLCELQTVRWHRTPGLVLATDQDPRSVAEIQRRYDAHVRAEVLSVKQVLTKGVPEGGFDLTYAAGLYDYLPEKVAVGLTRRLLDATASGGTVLIPNFVPECTGAGFMEYAMDWHLVYRDESDLIRMIEQATAPDEVGVVIQRDPTRQIATAVVTKA
jgi:hypothetical protein